MDEAVFWKLIEEAKTEMTPASSNQPELLQKKLEALQPPKIVEFDRMFTRLIDDAYSWDLWAAAYIIEGGCSDDGTSPAGLPSNARRRSGGSSLMAWWSAWSRASSERAVAS